MSAIVTAKDLKHYLRNELKDIVRDAVRAELDERDAWDEWDGWQASLDDVPDRDSFQPLQLPPGREYACMPENERRPGDPFYEMKPKAPKGAIEVGDKTVFASEFVDALNVCAPKVFDCKASVLGKPYLVSDLADIINDDLKAANAILFRLRNYPFGREQTEEPFYKIKPEAAKWRIRIGEHEQSTSTKELVDSLNACAPTFVDCKVSIAGMPCLVRDLARVINDDRKFASAILLRVRQVAHDREQKALADSLTEAQLAQYCGD